MVGSSGEKPPGQKLTVNSDTPPIKIWKGNKKVRECEKKSKRPGQTHSKHKKVHEE